MSKTTQSDPKLSNKPILLLSFANAKDNPLKIDQEREEILKSFTGKELKPKQKVFEYQTPLCDIIVLSEASIQDIVDTFQDHDYLDQSKRSRIAMFHYAGHAGEDALLLESIEGGGETQRAYFQGLASLFGVQSKQGILKFVFLNGCSSDHITESMLKAGVPAVLGTSKSIQDRMAIDLAAQFYQGLAEGNSLQRSWNMAEGLIRSYFNEHPSVGKRSPIFNRENDPPDQFPWQIKFGKGASHQRLKGWNLPEASNNPLHNLPLASSYFELEKFPHCPYKGLHYYEKENAALFFGRGKEIRDLHNQIQEGEPIILLHGKTGVGKSSLILAGLIPRIKTHHPIYLRRDEELGLRRSLIKAFDEEIEKSMSLKKAEKKASGILGSFFSIFDHVLEGTVLGEEVDLLIKWKVLEANLNKAVLVILDQAEEIYTRPLEQADEPKGNDELTELLDQIHDFWHGEERDIKGKMLLVFQEIFFAEVNEIFQERHIAYTDTLLKHLSRGEIIEVIRGVEKAPLDKVYNISYENNLPEFMADMLLAGDPSEVAPVLQMILHSLYERYVPDHGYDHGINKREGKERGHEMHKKHIMISSNDFREGISSTMEDFFQTQMKRFRAESTGSLELGGNGFEELFESGWIYEILFLHTTEKGAARSVPNDVIDHLFHQDIKLLHEVLRALEDLFLLIELRSASKKSTLLMHNTLAPVVRRVRQYSDMPAQRAMRILNTKMHEVAYWFPEDSVASDSFYPKYRDSLFAKTKGFDFFRENARKAYRGDDFYAFWEAAQEEIYSNYEELMHKSILTVNDLETVEKGKMGMRKWSKWEEDLISRSQEKYAGRRAKEAGKSTLLKIGRFKLVLERG